MRMTVGRLHARRIRMRVPIALTLLVAASACSAGTATSGVSRTVPVPQIAAPGGVAPIKVSDWQYLWTRVPGSRKHQCVVVHADWTAARSDNFVVGNFAAYIHGWDGTPATSNLPTRPGTRTRSNRHLGSRLHPLMDNQIVRSLVSTSCSTPGARTASPSTRPGRSCLTADAGVSSLPLGTVGAASI